MQATNENELLYSAGLGVDTQAGQILVGDEVIRLGPVNMQVLVCLMQRSGQVVSRAELFDRVWPNQVISDDSLTRCISELRSLLASLSNQKQLIETLPKRGYRWLPKVSDQPHPSHPTTGQSKRGAMPDWPSWLLIAIAALVGLALVSVGFQWTMERLVQPSLVRVALVPIITDQPDQDAVAADLSDLLRRKLLATSQLRYLASSALTNSDQNPYPYYSREFGAHWIIEGSIRQKGDGLRVALSLVDARTALVVYTLGQDMRSDGDQLESLCTAFVEDIARLRD